MQLPRIGWQAQEKRQPGGPERLPGLDYDIELARQMDDGSREALERFVDRHLGPLHGYISRRVGPGRQQLVTQVVSATFEEALRKMGPYVRGTALVPAGLWLIQLANRQLSKHKGTLKHQVEPDRSESSRLSSLREAMRRLPGKQQAALSLALFEEMEPDEIAGALGVSRWRAMNILRLALERVGEEMGLRPEEPFERG